MERTGQEPLCGTRFASSLQWLSTFVPLWSKAGRGIGVRRLTSWGDVLLHVGVFRKPLPSQVLFNPLKAELNPFCHLLALLVAHRIFQFSRI